MYYPKHVCIHTGMYTSLYVHSLQVGIHTGLYVRYRKKWNFEPKVAGLYNSASGTVDNMKQNNNGHNIFVVF